jgi:hypothetical protein
LSHTYTQRHPAQRRFCLQSQHCHPPQTGEDLGAVPFSGQKVCHNSPMKRWDQSKECYTEAEDPATDAFLKEITPCAGSRPRAQP